jgi:predicted DNA-binding transcriptional regulator YafY
MTVDQDGNGVVQKKIPRKELAFYARLLIPLGRDATIISPPELIAALKQRAQEILEHYS